MNKQQDFSRCKVGDKLWSIQLGDCEVVGWDSNINLLARQMGGADNKLYYRLNGFRSMTDHAQSLFFSNPNIVAPEPEKVIEISESKLTQILYGVASGEDTPDDALEELGL
tara:strand:+ start:2692 stop:3024 length:333 start_codon:yes stop_codon:yes gene_type:complete